MPTLEVLVATMNQSDDSLYRNMNLQTDAVICNQCDRFELRETRGENGRRIRLVSTPDRGVGKNRNMGLLNAGADICLMADDDMVYVDGYEEIVLRAFARVPAADAIIFQVDSLNPDRPQVVIPRSRRLRRHTAAKFGACRLAVRRERVMRKNIWFSLFFGGGAKYGSGEDTLFLWDMLKNGLRLYACADKIADVTQETSSWFTGHNDKYFFDSGALMAALGGRLSWPLTLLSAARLFVRIKRSTSFWHIWKKMREGRRDFIRR